MILVDTSVWIDHLHDEDDALVELLNEGAVASHPMVIGEIAVGSVFQRENVLAALRGLPSLPMPTEAEVLGIIEARSLHGKGLSLIDIYLLASVALAPGALIWTRDKRLAGVAGAMGFLA